MTRTSFLPLHSKSHDIFGPPPWNRQKQPKAPLPPVINTNSLLQFIEEGKQDEFQKARKNIDNTSWLKLAGAIVKKYPANDTDDLPRTNSSDANGNLSSKASQNRPQTQKQWLTLLLGTLPNQAAPRNLADALISDMGQYGDERKSISEQHGNQARILQFILDNTPSLLRDRNSLKQTIVHIAAINGAYLALEACVWVLPALCGCQSLSVHEPDCKELSAMLRAVDSRNYTPLHYAVLHGKTAAVVYILNQYQQQEPAETIRQLLQIAISCKHETSEEIIDKLLLLPQVEGAGREHVEGENEGDPEADAAVEYRRDIVQEDTLRHAIEHFQPNVFELLLDLSDENLNLDNCNLLHFAVSKGRDEAAIMLLNRYSKLAVQFQPLGPISGLVGNAVSEDDEKLSVFSCLTCSNTDNLLRRRVLEALMEQLPISQLREHLTGPSWFGKEISLDITNLALDPPLLDFFVYVTRKDLEDLARAEHRAASMTASNSKAAGVELPIRTTTEPQELQQTQREIHQQSSQAQPAPQRQQQVLYHHHRHRCRPPGMKNSVSRRGGVGFEHALKYVNIPSFGTGAVQRRTEALSIFRWLRECKGVERVFQVHVDDCRHHPHSEEDIEASLTGLGVRELDWQRVDLSVRSVWAAADKVEKLWLYSSGNSAVLDHWFGENGIRILPNLRNLYIKIIQDDFLSDSRALQCKDFCSNAPRPEGVQLEVSIATEWGMNMGSGTHGGPAGSARKLRPIEVTGLKSFLELYSTVPMMLRDQYPDIQNYSRIKVGVADTGISTARFSIDSHIVHGRSFVWTNTAKAFEHEAPWWLATDSHGSQMANIISQLDPHCVFYIAQITDDARYIEENNVIKAFEWLISEGVQIINCSFALRRSSPELRDVVRKARARGIVIMCSTSDEGENTDEVWPAAYYTQQEGAVERFDNVFPIVGCDEHGKPSRFSNESAGRYYFRGEDIDASGTDSELLKERGVVRGSSVATAIATGIASLVLACYQMLLLTLQTLKAPEAADVPGIVNAIFHKMQPMTIGPGLPDSLSKRHRLVTPSRFFPIDVSNIEDEYEFIQHIGDLYVDVLRARED
ncbi:subtilisin-like protein [Hypoxylon sp. FL0543]|nr:subtilisin-like protein [Hypoxylon sp. FL0543]